jgi:3-oxoacyl-[acyl-carrier protein] reductase
LFKPFRITEILKESTQMQTNDFLNKVAIVTGATGGIGEAIVADLAGQGCAVFAIGRNAQKLAELSQKHQGLAGAIQWVSEDLVEAQAPSRVIKGVLAWRGALNILVNCAGATKRGDFETLSDEDALDGFRLKLHAAVRLCREAWGPLCETQGSIINIGGVGAHTPSWEFTIGGPVNSALHHFSKALAERGIEKNVRINTIHPGFIETERLGKIIAKVQNELACSVDEAKETVRKRLGVQRFGQPADVAHMVTFLCSNKAAYINGAAINVDGGYTRGL